MDYAAVVAALAVLVHSHGLIGLAVVCFFSASLLPFPSEPIIAAATKFFDPVSILVVVTVSSTLAAIINYAVGLKGVRWILTKREKRGEKKAEKWFDKWGPPALLASPWIPFIGDLFPVAAGTLKMGWHRFLFWIIVARVIKTVAVIFLGIQVLKILGI